MPLDKETKPILCGFAFIYKNKICLNPQLKVEKYLKSTSNFFLLIFDISLKTQLK